MSKNGSYDKHLGDILDAFKSMQDKSFLTTVENLHDEHDEGKQMILQQIITRATKKHDKLLSRKEHYYNHNSKKYLNFAADSQVKSSPTSDNAPTNPRATHLNAMPK